MQGHFGFVIRLMNQTTVLQSFIYSVQTKACFFSALDQARSIKNDNIKSGPRKFRILIAYL